MRNLAVLILSLVFLLVAISWGQQPANQPTRSQLEARYEALQKELWATQNPEESLRLKKEIRAISNQLLALDVAALQANDPALAELDVKIQRTAVVVSLLSKEPPRWKVWRWRQRAAIQRQLRELGS